MSRNKTKISEIKGNPPRIPPALGVPPCVINPFSKDGQRDLNPSALREELRGIHTRLDKLEAAQK